jgi:hypothetical protein
LAWTLCDCNPASQEARYDRRRIAAAAAAAAAGCCSSAVGRETTWRANCTLEIATPCLQPLEGKMTNVGVVSQHQRPAPTRRRAAAHDSRLVHPCAAQLSAFWQLDLLVYVVDACSEQDLCVRLHTTDLRAALLIGAKVGADVGKPGDGRGRGCSAHQGDCRRQDSEQRRPCCCDDAGAGAGAGAACANHSPTAAWQRLGERAGLHRRRRRCAAGGLRPPTMARWLPGVYIMLKCIGRGRGRGGGAIEPSCVVSNSTSTSTVHVAACCASYRRSMDSAVAIAIL